MKDYAVGTQHSLAKYYHRLHQLLQDQNERVVLQVDIAGAYPNLSRRQIRKALSIRLPEFVPIFDMLYQAPSEHTILTADEGTKHVTQHIGLTQGSELSPLFFMIATDQPFEGERNTYWLKHQIKYADDIALVGTVDEVISDYQKLRTAFAK